MEKLRAAWHDVIDSLWFIPSVLTLTGATAAVLLMRYNDAILGDVDANELWWLFGGGADGAQSVLQVISGSLITVTGVIFSVTMIVLQLASSQFTPRVLRQFMADRANQLVLGVFISTFTYTLLVLRSIRGEASGEEYVPQIAVTGAVVLALVSIGFLIFFINHIARSVQAAHIIDAITRDTLRVVRQVFPHDEPEHDDRGMEVFDSGSRILARRAGYIESVDYEGLREIARERNSAIRVEVEIGSYVLPGQHVMTMTGMVPDDEVRGALLENILEGDQRTPRQDLKYGVLELMDIAVKAMSPSINDPTTAVNAIHRLSEILHELARCANSDRIIREEDGRILVVGRRPRLEDTIDLAFNQIRHYSADNPTVAIAMMRTLAELAALAPEHARKPFVTQLNAVYESARARIEDAGDRERMEEAAAHALSRAATPESTARSAIAAPT